MKFSVIAVLLALGGLPGFTAKLGRKRKIRAPPNGVKARSMSTNLRDAATKTNLRTRLAAAEREIERQKQRADTEEKLVNTLSSRVDVDEKRMARFIMHMAELEKKINGSIATPPPSPKAKAAVKLEHSELPATAAKALEAKHAPQNVDRSSQKVSEAPAKQVLPTVKNVPQKAIGDTTATKPPIVVKLAHANVPSRAAKSLEAKHVVQQNKSSDVGRDRIPDSDTLTAVDTEGADATDKSVEAELDSEDQDDIGAALAKEVESEKHEALSNSTGKTAVVHLAHRTVPATSSSEDPAPPAKIPAPPMGEKIATKVSAPRMATPKGTSAHRAPPVSSPMNDIPPPPPPLKDDATDELPPPPPPAAADDTSEDSEDVDADRSQSVDAGEEKADAADSDAEEASPEDELEKDNEAVSEADETEPTKPVIKTTADLEEKLGIPSEFDNADQEIASEEKELDSEEAAIGNAGPASTSSASESDDEAV